MTESPDDRTADEIQRLVSDALEDARDGQLDPKQLAELRQWLRSDSNARKAFLNHQHVCHQIVSIMVAEDEETDLPNTVSTPTSSVSDVVRYIALMQPKLRAYIRSIVFNPSDVDDILQDAAVIAIEKSDRYDPSRSLDAWVFGITKNRILKYLEKQKRQKLCFSTEFVEAITDAAASEPDSRDALESLKGCLDKLEDKNRSLLVRRHQPGVTSRDLAREIGYTDSRMSRMLNSLYATVMRCVENKLVDA